MGRGTGMASKQMIGGKEKRRNEMKNANTYEHTDTHTDQNKINLSNQKAQYLEYANIQTLHFIL